MFQQEIIAPRLFWFIEGQTSTTPNAHGVCETSWIAAFKLQYLFDLTLIVTSLKVVESS